MTCPKCFGKTKVINTYTNDDNIVRLRKCDECGYRFRTVEIDEDMYQRLEKSNEHDSQFRNSPYGRR